MHSLPDDLRAAAATFDWTAVHELCADYVAQVRRREDPPTADEWGPVLGLLRENRRYDDLVEVADALMAAGVGAPVLRRSVAQALVDRGAPVTARAIFEQLARDATSSGDAADLAEAEGSVARTAKDLFVVTTADRRRRHHLQEAYAGYRRVYDRSPEDNYWHGINAAALAARAGRDGAPLDGIVDPAAEAVSVARRVYASVTRVTTKASWHHTTACEACVALGDLPEAIRHAQHLVEDRAVTAFELSALLRQLTQVWQLTVRVAPGSDLLPLLRAGLLRRTGGDVLLSPSELSRDRVVPSRQRPELEKVFGADRYVSLPWYHEGLLRARAVCRIEDRFGNAHGTGFLVSSGDIGLADIGPVVLTNAHVVPDAVDDDDARIVFEAVERDGLRGRFGVTELVSTSPIPELDFTVLRIDGVPDDVIPVPVATKVTPLDRLTPQRAYVIGHPRGWSTPQISLHDNRMLDFDETYLHYRSPTDHGSSGSPVFDNSWNVIGLHHAGGFEMPRLGGKGGVYEANEAIRIAAIAQCVADARSGSQPGPGA